MEEEEVRPVADLVDRFFQTMDARDLAGMADLLARDDDVVHIGTDREERWEGWENLEAATREQFAGTGSMAVSYRDRVIKLLGDGDVASFSQVMDMHVEDGGEAYSLVRARLSGVAEQRAGRWVLVQTHLSLPRSSRLEGLRGLFDHLEWANGRALAALRRSGSDPGLRLFAHLLAAERVWLRRLRKGDSSGLEIWPAARLDDCAEWLVENVAAYRAYLGELSEDDLNDPVVYESSKGVQYRTPVGDILFHVLLHGSYHRGQIALRLREAGEKPMNTDHITFVR